MIPSPTPWQHVVLSLPERGASGETVNKFLGGGRGGGKTTAEQLLILRHVEQYQARARVLVIRTTFKATTEMGDELERTLSSIYPGTRYNRAERIFRLPSGATVELGEMSNPAAYAKYQGRTFSMLVIDDAGTLNPAQFRRAMMVKSNLRAPDGQPTPTIVSANPGGPLHTVLHRLYVSRAPAFEPFDVDGETWIYAPSTLDDNAHVDREAYLRQLAAACGNDAELLRAWEKGDWNVRAGAFFADCLDERVHMLPAAWPHAVDRGWAPFVAGDYGSAAPSVFYVVLRAPGDVGGFAKDSLVLLDEVASASHDDPSVGLHWPPSKIAEAVKERCAAWGVHPRGCCDDAAGLTDTLLSILREHGLALVRPRKERVAGWAKMRELLHNAKEKNGRPGLYATARCRYFWSTVPFISRDPHRPEDCDTSGCDHGADAARYACMYAHSNRAFSNGRAVGMY
ncbi:MAG: terminase family protein [bacterium]